MYLCSATEEQESVDRAQATNYLNEQRCDLSARLIRPPHATKQQIAYVGSRPDSARLLHEHPHSPIRQLQLALGNRQVAHLIHGKRLTPQGQIIGCQQKPTVGATVDETEGHRKIDDRRMNLIAR